MKTFKEQLYISLRQGIESGRLETGLVLLESNIAELFGTSRSPVRQTLNQLHGKGKISRFNGRGYLVGKNPSDIIRREITQDDINEIGDISQVDRQDSWVNYAEIIERDIVLSSMKGVFELNELKLARMLDVSRTITHRILLHLQSIGVVEKVKHSSWRIVPLNDERLHNLYEARCKLEPLMIARATHRMSKVDITDCINKLDQASARYPCVDSELLDELENDLHCDTVNQGGNKEVFNMLRRTRPILLISKHLLGSSIEFPANDPFFDEHRWIFERMLAGQSREASQALEDHLIRSESKVLERLALFRHKGKVNIPAYLKASD